MKRTEPLMEEVFQSLQKRFGDSSLVESNEEAFQQLYNRRKHVNAQSVDSYCADCIALVKALLDRNEADKVCWLLDLVLILSGPNDDIQKLIQLYCKRDADEFSEYPEEFYKKRDFPSTDALPRFSDPTVKEFKESRLRPFVATEISASWPALKKWCNPRFWLKLAGNRFFPVEKGSSYLDDEWSQDFMQLRSYLDCCVFCDLPPNDIVYIAQHNWLHQLPELENDFEVPELCDLFLYEALSCALIHFWFGMAGTLTPLHFDKHDNFFCQIVGVKKVILVSPEYNNRLSGGSSSSSNNTCSLKTDELKTLLQSIPHETVLVSAGQTLFIPKGWWHQVEAVTFSISISFWF